MLFRSTLAELSTQHTPSGTRIMAQSASNVDPLREKEKGAPGKKEEDRSPRTRSEGCSRICWRAVTGDRLARSFFKSLPLGFGAAVVAVAVVVGAVCRMAVEDWLDPVLLECLRPEEEDDDAEGLALLLEVALPEVFFFSWTGASTSR